MISQLCQSNLRGVALNAWCRMWLCDVAALFYRGYHACALFRQCACSACLVSTEILRKLLVILLVCEHCGSVCSFRRVYTRGELCVRRSYSVQTCGRRIVTCLLIGHCKVNLSAPRYVCNMGFRGVIWLISCFFHY